jgi:hypothetical protein
MSAFLIRDHGGRNLQMSSHHPSKIILNTLIGKTPGEVLKRLVKDTSKEMKESKGLKDMSKTSILKTKFGEKEGSILESVQKALKEKEKGL